MAGATPRFLSAGFILEEGLPLDVLESVVASMRAAACESGVELVTGDTKVVDRAKADGLFINTAGIGLDPAYVANEGRFVAFVDPADQDRTLALMRHHAVASRATRIGVVEATAARTVRLAGRFGTVRMLDLLTGEQLPRIC